MPGRRYIIVVQGRIPETLVERISALHAYSILQAQRRLVTEPSESGEVIKPDTHELSQQMKTSINVDGS